MPKGSRAAQLEVVNRTRSSGLHPAQADPQKMWKIVAATFYSGRLNPKAESCSSGSKARTWLYMSTDFRSKLAAEARKEPKLPLPELFPLLGYFSEFLSPHRGTTQHKFEKLGEKLGENLIQEKMGSLPRSKPVSGA